MVIFINLYRFYLVATFCTLPLFLNAQKLAEIDFEKDKGGKQFTLKDLNSLNGITVPWVDGFDQERAIIDTNYSHSEKHSLRILYPSGGIGPQESGAQATLNFTPSTQCYISYWMRFSDNFSWGSTHFGGKLPGLASGKNCSGCIVCDGTNGFSARLMWRENGKLVLYLYYMDKKELCGDDFDLVDENNKPFYVKKGDWIHVCEKVKVNSGNNADGEVQIWLNGIEAINKTGIKFVTNGDKVDNLYFSTFFGGSGPGWNPGVDCYIWFDDIVISTSEIL
jgi:hypothetical protein